MSAKAHPLTNSRSILFLLGSGSSGGFRPFTRVLIILFAGLWASLLTWDVAPRVNHLATVSPMPASMIQLLGQRFPSVAGQLTSSRAVERGDERVAGQLVTGFRMSQGENEPIAPAALLPVERMAWEAAARRANSSTKVKGDPESREFSVFFPGSYDGPFVAILGSQRVVLKAVGAKSARGVSRKGSVEYAGAYEGVDSLHVPGAGKSEEFLLLRSASAPVVFEYEVVETEGVSGIELREGALRFMPATPSVGSPFHSVESGALEIAKPWLVDAVGHRSAAAVWWEVVRSRPGEVAGAKLRLRVDAAGLTYPLLVDPAFTAVGLMTSARSEFTATLLPTGKVLIAGGFTESDWTNRAELFDPATGKFIATANMTLARAFHTATLLPSGQVLIAGGYTGTTYTNRAEVYDPDYGTFTGLFPNNLTSPRGQHTATLLKNGQVLIAGGFTSSGTTNTAELFDPASRTFTSIPRGTMNSARGDHTATLLSTGSVLIAGGVTPTGYTNTAELYDPFFGGFASLSNTMTSDRGLHTATLLGSGQVLIAGGFAGSGASNTAELFDPVSETFTSLSPSTMTSPRQNHTATLLPSGKVLLAGGITNLSGAVTNTAELFDPTSGNFYSLSPSTMTSARSEHTATLLPSGKVLLPGGDRGSAGSTNTADLYDPTFGTFTSYKSATTSAAAHHSATSLPDGKILIAGGFDGSTATNTANLFDPASAMFTALPPMTSTRQDHTTTLLLSGQVLLAGGSDANGGTTNTAELFDPSLGNFTSLSPNSTMTSARRSHTATLLSSGKVLLTGGDVNGSVTNTAELFDPVSAIFTATPTMTSARRYHTATLLPSGKILLAGGDVNGAITNTAELFHPDSGTFTSLPNTMTAARAHHTATLLPSGKVLLAGGGDVNSGFSNTAELFDPDSGTFTPFSPNDTMTSARADHTATLLASGHVLIAGGITGNSSTNTADLFDPASGTFTSLSQNNAMISARAHHTATLLPSGKVLIVGGTDANGGATNTAEAFDLGLGFSDARRPVISTAPNSLVQPASLVLSGTGFRGDSEGSGSSVNNSATNYPVLQLLRIDNEQTFFPLSNSATNWSDTSFSSGMLGGGTQLPRGYYRVTIFTNAIPSFQKIINIGSQPTTLGNISTRLGVETGDNVLIGGFIIIGTQPKKVIVRAIGPSLPLAGALADPVLELHGPGAFATITNDNWRSDQEAEIIATTIPPTNDLESAIVATLPANNSAYTAIVRGVNNGTGIGVVEAYDLDRTVDSKLANISTRGLVQTGDNVLIGGLIMVGPDPLRVIVRAIGPSLPLPGALGDPTLELRDGNGALIAFNDNWRSDQEAEIIATTIPPTNDLESAIVRNLVPGTYTAIVRGANNTVGVAVVEVYGLLAQ
jgi:hypothetical protein